MASVTIQIPDKFKTIVTSNTQLKRITSYFVEDYLIELYQDAQTKSLLENNKQDKEINTALKTTL